MARRWAEGVGRSRGGSPSAARRSALLVVRRVFEGGAYADRALHGAVAELDARDRALATRLAYGTVQRYGTLAHLSTVLSGRPAQRLDPVVRATLALGLYQLLYAGGIADHAAVNESVALAREAGAEAATGLVNAVLRRAIREGPELIAALDDTTPERAALCHSVPPWLAALWFDELGAEQARLLLASINHPAQSALRVNTLVTDASALTVGLPVGARSDPDLPEALVLDGPFDAHGSPLWREGAFMPQSRASMLVSRALDPQPAERVLDLCAAPGAKTSHVAALQQDQGMVVAVERRGARARALRETCRRLRADSVSVHVADAADWRSEARFQRVLVDPPCSGLGTLQSRPDLRWRASPEGIGTLVAQQERILTAGAQALAPGGLLVYSTCTLSAAENERQMQRFLTRHADFEVAEPRSDLSRWHHPDVPGHLLAMPHVHDTDGFFIGRLRRRTRGGRRNATATTGTKAT
ncbi:MAG TPA: 16S rRNA (cytosine(967)-C(5))-methyltransferase RsmB [Solirubrobacteraceae bacterium]|jgi:16S rRNA (cytosine967-C5)-methyltransferase|nr:16S rRNA (cytosine(967)-C(5))-methyltransferase RsmB [Solirubrobacteraceae bacterium]